MNLSDKPAFEALISELADVFPVSLNRLEAAKATYFKYLSDVSIDRMRSAILRAIQTLDSFPSIAKLRALTGVAWHETCEACAGKHRISHVKALTIEYYREDGQCIESALERIYGHCRTNYANSPEIRLWAKQAIAEERGWSTLPMRFQTAKDKARRLADLVNRKGETEGMGISEGGEA